MPVFATLYAKLIGAAIVVAMVGLIVWKIFAAGRNAERVDGMIKSLENARESRKIEREVATLSDDDIDDRLRPPGRR